MGWGKGREEGGGREGGKGGDMGTERIVERRKSRESQDLLRINSIILKIAL